MAETNEAETAAVLRAATHRCDIGELFSDKSDVVLAAETLVGLQVRARSLRVSGWRSQRAGFASMVLVAVQGEKLFKENSKKRAYYKCRRFWLHLLLRRHCKS